MQREAILLRVDGDGRESELAGGAHHANRDLTPVGDQNPAYGQSEYLSSSSPLGVLGRAEVIPSARRAREGPGRMDPRQQRPCVMSPTAAFILASSLVLSS